jgi:hypothetical protein
MTNHRRLRIAAFWGASLFGAAAGGSILESVGQEPGTTETTEGVSVVMHLSDAEMPPVVDALPASELVENGHDPQIAHAENAHPQIAPSHHGISYAPGRPHKPLRKLPGDIDRSNHPPLRYTVANCRRAGNPAGVAWWATPSINHHYSAWFVGGGAVVGGSDCCEPEGTWGMDYDGWLKPRRVWLKWTRGRHQGGEGAYKTDGHTGPLHDR